MDLYKKIMDCLPKMLLSKKSMEQCATNIYLTAMGVRPATFPFDIKKKRGPHRDALLLTHSSWIKTLKRIDKIPLLKVVVGKVHEGHTTIVVMNRRMYPKYKPLLQKMLDPSDKNHHIYVGTLLGYICPSNDAFLWKNQIEFDFAVNNIRYMGVTCSIDKKYMLLAMAKLIEIQKVLKKIHRHVELRVNLV